MTIEQEKFAKCPHCKGPIELRIEAGAPSSPIPYMNHEYADLTIVCITKGETRAERFLRHMRECADELEADFLVAPDGPDAIEIAQRYANRVLCLNVGGFVERVLNDVLSFSFGIYTLRLDDDEMISPALLEWLKDKKYLDSPTWNIPTMALWPDENHFITDKPLFPDYHLRLTAWDRTGGWDRKPHASAPYDGPLAPAALLHYKYIEKDIKEREELADHYEKISAGAGHGTYMPFTLPEKHYENGVHIAEVRDGQCEDIVDIIGSGELKTFD